MKTVHGVSLKKIKMYSNSWYQLPDDLFSEQNVFSIPVFDWDCEEDKELADKKEQYE